MQNNQESQARYHKEDTDQILIIFFEQFTKSRKRVCHQRFKVTFLYNIQFTTYKIINI